MVGVPRLTERDMAILKDLNKGVAMKMSQLERHFEGTNRYKYKRIEKLIERGYIRRDGHYYMLTVKGTKEVTGATNTIKVSKSSQKTHRSNVANIYLYLNNQGWEWYNSATAKKMYNLNRASKLEGILRNVETEEDYAVYVLSDRPQPKTINSIHGNIKSHTRHGLHKVIVFVPTPEAYRAFGNDPEKLVQLDTLSLCILPFGEKGFNLLKRTSISNWYLTVPGKPMITNLARIDVGRSITTQETVPLFADALATLEDGEEYYVCDMVSNDMIKLYHLYRYSFDQVQYNNGRGVLLLLLTSQYQLFAPMIESYPHIKMVPVPNEVIAIVSSNV